MATQADMCLNPKLDPEYSSCIEQSDNNSRISLYTLFNYLQVARHVSVPLALVLKRHPVPQCELPQWMLLAQAVSMSS